MSELKMPRRQLVLTDEERNQLRRIAEKDPRSYMRQRAEALLSIACGHSPHWVATSMWSPLKKPRHPETIYLWLNDYQAHRQLRPQPPRRGPFSPRRSRAGKHAGADPSGSPEGDGM